MKHILLINKSDHYIELSSSLPASVSETIYFFSENLPLGGVFYDHLILKDSVIGVRYWISDDWCKAKFSWKVFLNDTRFCIDASRKFVDIYLRELTPGEKNQVTLNVVQQFDSVSVAQSSSNKFAIYIEIDANVIG